ncbi:MAG TPA: hypothetical protein VE974_05425 [Thermoanaerobaculia bacterium]|nr:hypothetical protein [Thermoanaerobaculia bacterium]
MRRLIPLALVLCFATSLFATDDVIRRGFKVSEGGTLHLNADVGSIKVVSGGTGVAVEITRKADGRRGAERLAEHKIEFRQNGNDVVIEDDLSDGDKWRWSWSNDYEVQWNIRVPARYNLDLHTSGGSIELADIGGTVDADTSGGSISTGRLAGDSKLNTSGGSIRIGGGNGTIDARTSGGSIDIGETTGRVEARSSGGSIKIGRSGGEVIAKTSGGGIRIEGAAGAVDADTSGGSIHASLTRQPTANSSLTTSGGSVTIILGRGIGADLDAKASGGSVSSDVPITVQGTMDEDELRGKINGGGPKLVVRASGGGVRVRGE